MWKVWKRYIVYEFTIDQETLQQPLGDWYLIRHQIHHEYTITHDKIHICQTLNKDQRHYYSYDNTRRGLLCFKKDDQQTIPIIVFTTPCQCSLLHTTLTCHYHHHVNQTQCSPHVWYEQYRHIEVIDRNDAERQTLSVHNSHRTHHTLQNLPRGRKHIAISYGSYIDNK